MQIRFRAQYVQDVCLRVRFVPSVNLRPPKLCGNRRAVSVRPAILQRIAPVACESRATEQAGGQTHARDPNRQSGATVSQLQQPRGAEKMGDGEVITVMEN